ncbi:hypothetical protein [Marinimicrobium alkaliphilum]|uniref:hypothetical protein n=1 Tax=Marinimicrobium alkaliphilum TaxID=2202654 RepID=UPI000DB9AE0B|nr:hypothetical protein [Marinimicrobium alkaliphilum]
MTTEQTVEQLHQLVLDYHQRGLSTVDYRHYRRDLLNQLDARINGVQLPQSRAVPADTDLITRRKDD